MCNKKDKKPECDLMSKKRKWLKTNRIDRHRLKNSNRPGGLNPHVLWLSARSR